MSDGCLEESDLLGIIRQACPSIDLERFTAHLDRCEACRQRLETMAGKLTTRPPRPHSAALADVVATLKQDGCEGASTIGPTPRAIGRYTLQRELGRGGMGIVYAAVDTELKREVAVKLPAAIDDQESNERFLREARSVAAVRHDHIVTIYSVESIGGRLLLVMELVEGESLSQRLQARGGLSWKEAARIGVAVASALEAAHARGVIHRDIKPANILLERPDDRVKVTDFGLAKSTEDPALTATGILAGSPEYMSPEQADESEVGPPSDVFSLGTVLYQTCTAVSPFRAETTLSTLRRIVEHVPPKLHQVDPTTPLWFSDLVAGMLAKRPDQRPASSTEVRRLLQTGLAEPEPPSNSVSKKNSFAMPALIAGLLCVLVGIAAWSSSHRGLTDDAPDSERNHAPGFVVAARHYTSLTAALAEAGDGDVIEVFGDGPFRVPGFDLASKRIEIHASEGDAPIFESLQEIPDRPFLRSDSDLTLQRLEIRWPRSSHNAGVAEHLADRAVIEVNGGMLGLKNCHIITGASACCVGCKSASAEIVDSAFTASDGACLVWVPHDSEILRAENCVFQSDHLAIGLVGRGPPATTAKLRLMNNAFSARWIFLVTLEDPRLPIEIDAVRNAFDATNLMVGTAGESFAGVPTFQQIGAIRQAMVWTETENAYGLAMSYWARGMPLFPDRTRTMIDSLHRWSTGWGQQESGSYETRFAPVDENNPARRLFPGLRRPVKNLDNAVGADLQRVGPRRESQSKSVRDKQMPL